MPNGKKLHNKNNKESAAFYKENKFLKTKQILNYFHRDHLPGFSDYILVDQMQWKYCKTCYFAAFWTAENSLHLKFVFSHQCSTGIHQAFDGQTEFSWVFNFAILSYLQKFHALKKITWFTVLFWGNNGICEQHSDKKC